MTWRALPDLSRHSDTLAGDPDEVMVVESDASSHKAGDKESGENPDAAPKKLGSDIVRPIMVVRRKLLLRLHPYCQRKLLL